MIVSIFGRVQAGITPAPSISYVESAQPTESPTVTPSLITSQVSGTSILGAHVSPSSEPMESPMESQSDVPSLQPSEVSNPGLSFTSSTSAAANSLSPEELANRLQLTNSYCAASLQEAKDKCSLALTTCNDNDPPCVIGTACFGNVVCSMPGENPTESSNLAADEDTRESSQVPSTSPSVAAPLLLSPVSCGQICLRPLIKEECTGVGNSILHFSDCASVGVGQICQSLGECGPKALIHNCRGHSVYIRVLPDQCSQLTTDDAPMGTTSSPSLPPSPQEVSLNDALASQTSQYSQQDYGSVENAWWRDVPLNSSTANSSTMLSWLFAVSFILLYTIV